MEARLSSVWDRPWLTAPETRTCCACRGLSPSTLRVPSAGAFLIPIRRTTAVRSWMVAAACISAPRIAFTPSVPELGQRGKAHVVEGRGDAAAGEEAERAAGGGIVARAVDLLLVHEEHELAVLSAHLQPIDAFLVHRA